jgi:hypothetical protein
MTQRVFCVFAWPWYVFNTLSRLNGRLVLAGCSNKSNAVPTTCHQDVFALLVPSLATTCYKVLELNRLVTSCSVQHLRLVSTQENYPWIGTDKKIFLCLVSSGLELMTLTQRKIFLSVPTTDNFPEWN